MRTGAVFIMLAKLPLSADVVIVVPTAIMLDIDVGVRMLPDLEMIVLADAVVGLVFVFKVICAVK